MKAFPSKTHSDDFHQHYVEKGMDLRDYFAAKAMQSIVSDPNFIGDGENYQRSVAELSYAIANEMLKQSKKYK